MKAEPKFVMRRLLLAMLLPLAIYPLQATSGVGTKVVVITAPADGGTLRDAADEESAEQKDPSPTEAGADSVAEGSDAAVPEAADATAPEPEAAGGESSDEASDSSGDEAESSDELADEDEGDTGDEE
jgi:hypothetical protein